MSDSPALPTKEDSTAASHTTLLGSSSSSSGEQTSSLPVPTRNPEPVARPRIAWLIAQEKYNHFDDIPHVSNDVVLLQRRLEKFGFRVTVVRNVNKESFAELSGQFVRNLSDKPGAIFFLFFGGHGLWCRDQMMLVPADAKCDDPSTWVSLKSLLQPVHDVSGAPLNHQRRTAGAFGAGPSPGTKVLVVLDCCRQVPKCQCKPEQQTIVDALEEITKPTITTTRPYHRVTTELSIIYACDEERVAHNHKNWKLGIFTLAFLRGLKEPGLSWYDLFKRSRDECMRIASKDGKQQRPWIYSSTGTEVVLHEDSVQMSDEDIDDKARDDRVVSNGDDQSEQPRIREVLTCCCKPDEGLDEPVLQQANLRSQNILHVTTFKALRAYYKLYCTMKLYGTDEIQRALEAAKEYASANPAVIIESHKFPEEEDNEEDNEEEEENVEEAGKEPDGKRQESPYIWGDECYLALYDARLQKWVFFDHYGLTERYVVQLASQ